MHLQSFKSKNLSGLCVLGKRPIIDFNAWSKSEVLKCYHELLAYINMVEIHTNLNIINMICYKLTLWSLQLKINLTIEVSRYILHQYFLTNDALLTHTLCVRVQTKVIFLKKFKWHYDQFLSPSQVHKKSSHFNHCWERCWFFPCSQSRAGGSEVRIESCCVDRSDPD